MTETATTTETETAPAGERPATVEDVRSIYAGQADQFDRLDFLNRLFTGRYRRRLFQRAEGRVLDVACGTGTNRRYLPGESEYVGIDLSPEMLDKARKRFEERGFGGTLTEMDAEDLAFDDDSFGSVVSSLSTCTFPDPDAALGEMARVCEPDGRILLLEHGRSSVGPVARFQDWRAHAHYEKHACRLNQQPVEVVRNAGLSVTEVSTAMLGIVTAIEARP